mmetsp:Transcript_4552/g.11468  ORF Transcript_4552/g.11468 Transcript_4552/m.11468 type:complete len:200 (-) Transcript_4552:2704-3303(-)
MLMPSVRNLRRSSMTAWKYVSANSSLLYLCTVRHSAYDSSVTHVWYSRARLARRPLGGSVVIFSPRWRIANGKDGVGLDDSHSRKFSCGATSSNLSMIFCSSGSHDSMRWQLARNTQLPSTVAVEISLVATGAWPCPSATLKKRSPSPLAAASCRRLAVGSTPGDNTKMSGASGVESPYVSYRSSTGGSTKRRPNELAT